MDKLQATISFPVSCRNGSDKVGEHSPRTCEHVDTHTYKAICSLSPQPRYRAILSTCMWVFVTFSTDTHTGLQHKDSFSHFLLAREETTNCWVTPKNNVASVANNGGSHSQLTRVKRLPANPRTSTYIVKTLRVHPPLPQTSLSLIDICGFEWISQDVLMDCHEIWYKTFTSSSGWLWWARDFHLPPLSGQTFDLMQYLQYSWRSHQPQL